MCRGIKTLFNFASPGYRRGDPGSFAANRKEALGFNEPSRASETVFRRAVDEVTAVAWNLLDSLVTGDLAAQSRGRSPSVP